MRKQELTFAEFSELPLLYSMGVRYTHGAQRMYRNDQIGLQVEVYTPFSERTMRWGRPDKSWFLDGDEREFSTCDQAYVAYMERVCGVTA